MIEAFPGLQISWFHPQLTFPKVKLNPKRTWTRNAASLSLYPSDLLSSFFRKGALWSLDNMSVIPYRDSVCFLDTRKVMGLIETFEKLHNFCHRLKDNGFFWSDLLLPPRRASRSERRCCLLATHQWEKPQAAIYRRNADRAKLPHGYVVEKTNPGASELKKSPLSLDQ